MASKDEPLPAVRSRLPVFDFPQIPHPGNSETGHRKQCSGFWFLGERLLDGYCCAPLDPGFRDARLAECPGSLRTGPESHRSVRQLPECPGSLRGNGFRCLGPGSWDARLAECPGSLRAESGVSQESPDPGEVSLESFYDLGHAARLSECPRSLRESPTLQGVSGAPGVSVESFSMPAPARGSRSVLGVSGRPRGPGVS